MHNLTICFIFFLLSYSSYSQIDSTVKFTNPKYLRNGTETIISRQEIEDSYGKTLAGLLNEQAGIVVNGAFHPQGSFTNIYIDGYLGGKVLIMLDGIPVWDPSSISSVYFDLNYIPLNEIEEIHINRGCKSAVYGSGAIAGTINIITKKSRVEKPINVMSNVGFGNKKTISSNLQLWGSIKKIGYQIAYSTSKTSGFSYAQDTLGNKAFDNDGFRNSNLNARLEYKLLPSLTLFGYTKYNKYNASSDEEGYIDTKDYYYSNSFTYKGLGISYYKKEVSIEATYMQSNTVRKYHYAASSSEYLAGSAEFARLSIILPLSKRLTINGGVDYRHHKISNTFYDSATGHSSNKYPSPFEYGLFSSITYKNIDSSYIATFTSRINKHNISGIDYAYSICNSYQITKRINLIANINTGFLNPSIYATSDSTLGNKRLSSESNLNLQIGAVMHSKNLLNKIVLFKNHLSREINFNYNTNTYANCDGLDASGFEYEIETHLLPFIKLTGNYTYLIGKEITISRQNFFDTVSYNYLARRPKHIINCNLTYETKNESRITLSFRYISPYFDVGFAESDKKLDGFLVINFQTKFQLSNHFYLYSGIYNLSNTKFHDTIGYNRIPLLLNIGVSMKL